MTEHTCKVFPYGLIRLCILDRMLKKGYYATPAWRMPGTGEPGGLPSMGSQRVGHFEHALNKDIGKTKFMSHNYLPTKFLS